MALAKPDCGNSGRRKSTGFAALMFAFFVVAVQKT
jgi:hypothetical protein